jgi:hypothetical protein
MEDARVQRRRRRPAEMRRHPGRSDRGHREWVEDATARRAEACPTFAMAIIGGIGDMPDTLEDRAVVISMRRRAPGENVTQWRARRAIPPGRIRTPQVSALVDAQHRAGACVVFGHLTCACLQALRQDPAEVAVLRPELDAAGMICPCPAALRAGAGQLLIPTDPTIAAMRKVNHIAEANPGPVPSVWPGRSRRRAWDIKSPLGHRVFPVQSPNCEPWVTRPRPVGRD